MTLAPETVQWDQREITLSDSVRIMNKIGPLKEHEGWKYIQAVLQTQAQMRVNQLVTGSLGLPDDAPEERKTKAEEYLKGEIHMLWMLGGLVDTLMSQHQDNVDTEKRRRGNGKTSEEDN